MCALAVRFNTTVSASDARLANMSYASKISQERLLRSQERSKWYQLTEQERTEILFPAPRKIQFDYYAASPDQTRQVESHFMGEGMHWRPKAMSAEVTRSELINKDLENPAHNKVIGPAHRPWHAGGGGFEGVGSPGPGTRPGKTGSPDGIANKIGTYWGPAK